MIVKILLLFGAPNFPFYWWNYNFGLIGSELDYRQQRMLIVPLCHPALNAASLVGRYKTCHHSAGSVNQAVQGLHLSQQYDLCTNFEVYCPCSWAMHKNFRFLVGSAFRVVRLESIQVSWKLRQRTENENK